LAPATVFDGEYVCAACAAEGAALDARFEVAS